MKNLRVEGLAAKLCPWLVLLAGLSLTAASTSFAKRAADQGAAQLFDELVREIEHTIAFRMQAYVSVLLQTRGLFVLSGEPTREQFREYMAASDLLGVYPGVRGIGYSKWLATDEGSSGADRAGEGHTSIVILEPLDWRNRRAIGYDMFREPVRHAAMSAARDSGLPTMSGKVTLGQETEADTQPEFLIFVPLYREALPPATKEGRRASLLGFIYSPFRAQDLFTAMIWGMRAAQGKVAFSVYDGTAGDREDLIFGHRPSPHTLPDAASHERDFSLAIAGRTWRIHAQALPTFTRTMEHRAPRHVAAFGSVVSLLLFWIVRSNNRRRAAAEELSRRDRFLAEVNAVFDSSTDYHATFDRVARVAVPRFADLCIVEVMDENSRASRAVIAHSDPETERLLRERAASYPVFGVSTEHGSGKVFRTGEPDLIRELPDTLLAQFARGEEDLELARRLGLRSLLCVPLASSGQIFGTITFLTAESDRRYGKEDLATASEVAARASIALENSRLFRAIQAANLERELILNSTGEGIYGLDRHGVATFVNPAAARMAGFEIDELVGKSLHQIVHHSHADGSPYPAESCLIYRAFRDGAPYHADSEVFWRKDGTPFPVEYTSTPLRKQGEVVGAVVVVRDISERKRAESELRAAKLAAESASMAKSSFLANMSHEIRTPLTAIMGFTQLLLDPGLDEADRRAFGSTITRNGRLLMQIIDDILDLSKIESGKVSLEKIPSSLPGVVGDVTRLLAPLAQAKGLLLEVSVGPDVPASILTDPTRLKQILINILGNAIKFTDKGRVDVACELLAVVGQETPTIAFTVSDTGRGIPLARQSELFQPFTQADSSTTRRFGGTGLGLALSRRLAEALGGAIELTRSKPGEGSTFTIHVPAEGASGRFEEEPVQPAGDATDQARSRRLPLPKKR